MTNQVWPSALCPAGMEWRIQKAGLQFDPQFSGDLQAVSFIGERWDVNIELHGEGRRQLHSGELDALLMHLSGGINQVDIYHWVRPVPRGTLRGAPTVQTTTARGDAQLLLTVAAGSTLESGDLIGAGSQVFMTESACAAVGTLLTVPLVNRVRGVISAGAAVTWDRPMIAAVMPELSAGLTYTPGQTLPAQLQLLEAF